MKREYRLIPKSGKGATWYTDKTQIFKRDYAAAISKDGFETIVKIDNYIITK